MRRGNALFLIRQHWRFHWSSWAVVALLVTVSAAVLALIGGTTLAISGALNRWTEDIFPPTIITVRHPTPELSRAGFFLAAAMPRLEHPALAPDQLDRVEALPGVQRVFPVSVPTFPVYAEASFMGETMGTDAVLAGIDRELILADIESPDRFQPVDWQSGEPIPVLISSYFIDLFNLLYAPTMELPPLSEVTAQGFRFDLMIGESVLGGSLATSRQRRVPAEIVGLTRNPQLMGVTMPRQTLEELQRWHDASREPRHGYAFVQVDEDASMATLTDAIEAMGLTVDTPPDIARVMTLDRLLRLASGALQTLIFGLTLFGSVCLMILQMEHRRPSLQFLHISGVPAPTIRALMLGEAGGVALGSAAIGASLAIFLTRAALGQLSTLLPTSLPVPTLGPVQAALVAIVATLVIGAGVTLAALAVVATQHRRIAERPIG